LAEHVKVHPPGEDRHGNDPDQASEEQNMPNSQIRLGVPDGDVVQGVYARREKGIKDA